MELRLEIPSYQEHAECQGFLLFALEQIARFAGVKRFPSHDPELLYDRALVLGHLCFLVRRKAFASTLQSVPSSRETCRGDRRVPLCRR
jgi:hypothetical protein